MSTAPIEAQCNNFPEPEETEPYLHVVPDYEPDPHAELQRFLGESVVLFSFSVSLSSAYVGNIKVGNNLLVSLDTSIGEQQVLITKELAGFNEDTRAKLGSLAQPHNRQFTA